MPLTAQTFEKIRFMLQEQENMREIPKKYIFAIPGTAPSK